MDLKKFGQVIIAVLLVIFTLCLLYILFVGWLEVMIPLMRAAYGVNHNTPIQIYRDNTPEYRDVDDIFLNIENTYMRIRELRITDIEPLPVTSPDKVKYAVNQINTPVNIISDSQNTHDSAVNRTIRSNIEILQKSQKIKLINSQLVAEINEFVKNHKSHKFEITEQLTKWLEAGHVYAFKLKPVEALELAWSRSTAPANAKIPGQTANIREAILLAVEDKSHVCSHGMVVSCIGALDGTDQVGDLQQITTKSVTIRDVSEFVSHELRKILANYSDATISQYYLDVLDNKNVEDKLTEQEKTAVKKFVQDELELRIRAKFGDLKMQDAQKFVIGEIDFLFS